ncbi:hypothetical protein C7974DRAFT_1233 [Boeremia exigua]|uniref:uncharacterized protein n=1 Tax=Boeremia exigua TaxID=749465 RepID=UPI001E8EC15C|nr:uncharacterized protein C7974DRAFT_1233 [Boeremia exigua]KAH6643601.1 hypothetical protein C7974DRAFT_1233 [Boeremia exigua]
MLSVPPPAFQLLIFLRAISASPLPQHHQQAKRSTTHQNIGSGFAIAICTVILACFFYFLGMRHECTKSWFNKRKAYNESTPARETGKITEERGHKRQISYPLAVVSSAPIKPYDEPVEAPTASLRYYELPIKEIHEMGLPSPKKQPRASWLSFDRKPWWMKYPESNGQRRSARTSGSKSMRSWFKSGENLDVTHDKDHVSSCHTTETVHGEERSADLIQSERKSNRSSLMDWSGLDYVRRIYMERKSRVGL